MKRSWRCSTHTLRISEQKKIVDELDVASSAEYRPVYKLLYISSVPAKRPKWFGIETKNIDRYSALENLLKTTALTTRFATVEHQNWIKVVKTFCKRWRILWLLFAIFSCETDNNQSSLLVFYTEMHTSENIELE